MSHPFGDVLSQYLHRKHGLSQSKLADGILQAPTIISAMCKGRRLTGPQARERVVAIIGWLERQGVLASRAEANALLDAAGMAPLQMQRPTEADLLRLLPDLTEKREKVATDDVSAQSAVGSESPIKHERAQHNLPARLTPFVGRAVEMTELASLLADPAIRLVTLLGPGGIGKTRLALEAAATLLNRFSHGVYFVSLAGVESAYTIIPLIADALNFSFQSEGMPYQQLCDYLRQKNLLLVLDNFEHLIDAAPLADVPELKGITLVRDLLHAAPQIKIVVTSRIRLHLQGEQLYVLDGIDVPPSNQTTLTTASQSSAVDLFVQSARRVQPGFELTPDNVEAVVRICRLVQGMPLAILLAAGWIPVLSPAEILLELSQYDVANQSLDFLGADVGDIPVRQRSVRAVFDHSWHLLTEPERRLLTQLSVFRKGFTREAAEKIVDVRLTTTHEQGSRPQLYPADPASPPPTSIVKMLRDLVNKSLLRVQQAPSGRWRYDMHELVRQYAAERLLQTPDGGESVRERHSRFYCAWLGTQEARLKGSQQQTALTEIDRERGNVRAAWRWAIAHSEFEHLARAMHSLGFYYEWRNRYQEGEAVFSSAVRQLQVMNHESPAAQQGLVQALVWQSVFCRLLRRLAESGQLLQQSLDRLEHSSLADPESQRVSAFVFLQQGRLCYEQIEYARGEAAYQQALMRYRALGDTWGEANALVGLGILAYRVGDYEQPRAYYEASLAQYRLLGDYSGSANALERLGDIFRDQGQFETAQQLTLESIALYERLNDRAKIAYGQLALGLLYTYMGRFHDAYAVLQQCAPVFEELGLTAPLMAPISGLAVINMELGRYSEANAQLHVYLAQSRSANKLDAVALALVMLAYLAVVDARYTEANQLASESRALFQEINDQDRLSFTIACQGYVARALGQLEAAWQYFADVLLAAAANRSITALAFALPGIALLLADQGKHEQAVEVYAQISSLGFVANSQLRRDLAGAQLDSVAAALPPDVAAAARARGKAGDLWATARALLIELYA